MATSLTTHRQLAALAAVMCALAAAVFTACGDDDGGGDNASSAEPKGQAVEVSEDPAIAKLVPGEIRDRGELLIATDAPYPPLALFDEDNKTLIGFEIDFGNALGEVLGLDVSFEHPDFDSVIPSRSRP